MQTICRTMVFAATISLLAGCATTAPTEGGQTAPSLCQTFQPIRWSEQDTRDTVRQVIGHNAAGKAVCGWEPVVPKGKAVAKAKAKPKPAPTPKPKPKSIMFQPPVS